MIRSAGLVALVGVVALVRKLDTDDARRVFLAGYRWAAETDSRRSVSDAPVTRLVEVR